MTKEALLALWMGHAPTVRCPYAITGHKPMWETLRIGDMVLFTCPGTTQERPFPLAPYEEVAGLAYQWQRNGMWVGQGRSTTFKGFEANGPKVP